MTSKRKRHRKQVLASEGTGILNNIYNQLRTAGPRWRQGKTYSLNGERECERRRIHTLRTGRYDNGQLV